MINYFFSLRDYGLDIASEVGVGAYKIIFIKCLFLGLEHQPSFLFSCALWIVVYNQFDRIANEGLHNEYFA